MNLECCLRSIQKYLSANAWRIVSNVVNIDFVSLKGEGTSKIIPNGITTAYKHFYMYSIHFHDA